jgi:pyruvate/2-oxoglutarate dehydrogenase complex dihydrolipoamide acyltransferase (E2) component
MVEAPYKVVVPQETVNDESVRLVAWNIASGAVVVKDQLICEIETSKTVVEIYAPVAGVLTYHLSEGDEIEVGKTICEITPEISGLSSQPENGEVLAYPQVTSSTLPEERELPPARFTPLARKIAAEYKIDISSFPKGRLVRKNDILSKAGVEFQKATPTDRAGSERRQAGDVPLQAVAVTPVRGVPIEWNDLPRTKIIEGKVLRNSRATCVQSSVTASVKAPAIRERINTLELTTTGLDALILFEVGRLLLRYPMLNAIYDAGRVGSYQEINVGWALDGGKGLIVPVVRSCDRKSVREIAAVMERQLETYLEGSLTLEDLAFGTFTISNLSGHGVQFFTPLISQGQSAILGIGSDPNAPDGELFYLTLAFDHQLTEGRHAAQFVRELSYRLEAHSLLEIMGDNQSSEPPSAKYCVVCHRDQTALRKYKALLLKSEVPAGLVCSLCITGF